MIDQPKLQINPINMRKKLIIASESTHFYTTERLLTEGKKLKWSIKWINPYESVIAPNESDKNGGLYFIRTSGTRYDDFDLTLAMHYSALNYKITNPLNPIQLFRTKDRQAVFFNEHNLNHISSVMFRGPMTNELKLLLENLSSTEDYVLKMNRGNQGIGVNLIKGKKSLFSFIETFHAMKDQRFIIQPYLPHQKELRVFVIKNEIKAIVEKEISPDDFRGNSKRSLGKIIHKIPRELRDEIIRASMMSQLDYCGVDILLTKKGDFKFLEINPVPGFLQIEKLSGLNIAGELINLLK